jgi:PIN domain nuclease of toxin-antitoxin system
MKVLLDTHTFLWYLWNDPNLSEEAKRILALPETEAYVSVASLWEIAIKVSLGKLTIGQPLEQFFPEQLSLNNFYLLPIDVHHTAFVSQMPFHHKDPFDRILIAQSLLEKIPILGTDVVFDQYNVQRIWS